MSDIIQVDPEIMSGIPVFKGTRVPVKNLFDYFEAGHTISDFLDDFPSVRKEQIIRLLRDLQDETLKSKPAA